MGRKKFRPKCEGQRRSTLPPRSLKHCHGHYPKRCVANSQTPNKRSQSSHGFLLSSGIEESSQVALKRLFSRRPPLEASQFSKSLIRTLCSTSGSLKRS